MKAMPRSRTSTRVLERFNHLMKELLEGNLDPQLFPALGIRNHFGYPDLRCTRSLDEPTLAPVSEVSAAAVGARIAFADEIFRVSGVEALWLAGKSCIDPVSDARTSNSR